MTNKNKLDAVKTNTEWVVMKCLIDAQQETVRAMEHHALSSLTQRDQLSNRELLATLREAKHSHERAIADIDTALEQLTAQASTDGEVSVDSAEQ